MSTKIWLVCLSAMVTAIAFPPYRVGFLVFFSPILLLLALEGLSLRRAFGIGYIWGLVFNLSVLYGVFWATIPGTFGMLAIVSLVFAVIVAVYRYISVRSRLWGYIIWPFLWVSWDYLRTLTEFNFPWGDYGYALSYYLPMIQAADIFGVYGISLIIHSVTILLYILIRHELNRKIRFGLLSAVIVLPLILLLYGWAKLPAKDNNSEGAFKIALLQGNITRELKWQPGGADLSFDEYLEMTRSVLADSADLVIWPETATPFYLAHKPKYLKKVKDLVDSADVNILTGLPQYETAGPSEYIYFNAAALISPHVDSLPIYEKVKLVPMSERIPFSGRFKKLRDIHLGQADFSSGRYKSIFSVNNFKFSTVICFESAFPDYCADFCRAGAQFLVIITNDMWFGPSSLPYQHAQMSVLRAVENRIPIARCANTGVSMFIDKWGRTFGTTKMMQQAVVVNSINPEKSSSLYNRWGDILPLISIFTTLTIIIAVAILKRGQYNEAYEN